ncbi:unnamed protein product, partial [marine sediment metagenome]
ESKWEDNLDESLYLQDITKHYYRTFIFFKGLYQGGH